MPDLDSVIFEGKFDPSQIIAGTDSVIDHQKKLTAIVKENSIELKRNIDTYLELQVRQAQLKKGIDELDKTSKTYTQDLKILQSEYDKTTLSANALLEIGKKSSKEYEQSKTSLSNYNKIVKDTGVSLKDAEGATGGFSKGLHSAYGGLQKIAYLIPGLGMAGLIAIISGPAVAGFEKLIEEINKAGKAQKLLSEINDEAAKSFGGDVAKIDILKEKLNDLTIPQNERILLAKEYNKLADDGNRIDTTQIDNLDLINSKINAEIKLLKERAIAKAGENILSEKAESLFRAQIELETKFPEFSETAVKQITDRATKAIEDSKKRLGIKGKVDTNELLAFADLPEDQLRLMAAKNERFKILLDNRDGILLNSARQLKAISDYKTGQKTGGGGAALARTDVNIKQKDFDETLKVVAELSTTPSLLTDDKTKREKKALEDDFEKRKATLLEEIAKLAEAEYQGEVTIRKEYAAKLNKAIVDINKDKSLKSGERKELISLATQLNTGELDKALGDFANKQKAAREKIENEIIKVQLDAGQKRIENIRDQFEREKQAIEENYSKTSELLRKEEQTQLNQIEKDRTSGLIGENDAIVAELILHKLFGDLLTEAGIARTNKQIELAFKIFENTVKESKITFDEQLLGQDIRLSASIIEDAKLYVKGAISYEEYEKRKTKAAKAAQHERNLIRIEELKSELSQVESQLSKTPLDDPNNAKLKAQRRAALKALADAEQGDAELTVDTKNTAANKKLKNIESYISAIGELTQSVISFWEKANEAEQKQLDRSIKIQETRVATAQRLADRGNAQYLRGEEDRLTQLRIKQENAAKRQLAINAAIQASSVLVGIAGAISKIATPGIGIAEVFAEIAVIIGAIATGYEIVQSLKTPTFFTGTEDTGKGGNVDSKGGFPATLHPHERVVTAEQNKQLRGISNKDLVQMVANYPRYSPVMTVPTALPHAVNMAVSQDGRLHQAMKENTQAVNEMKYSVAKAIRNISVSQTMDANGIAQSVTGIIKEFEIAKYT